MRIFFWLLLPAPKPGATMLIITPRKVSSSSSAPKAQARPMKKKTTKATFKGNLNGNGKNPFKKNFFTSRTAAHTIHGRNRGLRRRRQPMKRRRSAIAAQALEREKKFIKTLMWQLTTYGTRLAINPMLISGTNDLSEDRPRILGSMKWATDSPRPASSRPKWRIE